MSDSATPWTVDHQAFLSMRFFRQESWSGLPFPSPGDFSHPRIKPMSTCVSCISKQIPYHWATKEAQNRHSQSWIHTRITRVVLKFCDAWTPAPPKPARIFRGITPGMIEKHWAKRAPSSTHFSSLPGHPQHMWSRGTKDDMKVPLPQSSPLPGDTQAPIGC